MWAAKFPAVSDRTLPVPPPPNAVFAPAVATVLNGLLDGGRQCSIDCSESSDGVSLMTTTPQPTQHLTFAIDDPRTIE
jgi:hypothetical protein